MPSEPVRHTPEVEPLPLDEVLITSALDERPSHVVDSVVEHAAYLAIADQLEATPRRVLQSLCESALRLCRADASGISLLERQPSGDAVFRWTVMAGTLAAHVNGTTPRDFSPCGVCLDMDAPVLFRRPDLRFTYFQAAGIPFHEGLVIPFRIDTRPTGTMWIITHDPNRHFDREDVGVMTELAGLAGMAYSRLQRRRRSQPIDAQQIDARP